jgi:hypothetical protein
MQKFKERAKASLVKLGVQASPTKADLKELRQRVLDSMSPKPEDRKVSYKLHNHLEAVLKNFQEMSEDMILDEKPAEENLAENSTDSPKVCTC